MLIEAVVERHFLFDGQGGQQAQTGQCGAGERVAGGAYSGLDGSDGSLPKQLIAEWNEIDSMQRRYRKQYPIANTRVQTEQIFLLRHNMRWRAAACQS